MLTFSNKSEYSKNPIIHETYLNNVEALYAQEWWLTGVNRPQLEADKLKFLRELVDVGTFMLARGWSPGSEPGQQETRLTGECYLDSEGS